MKSRTLFGGREINKRGSVYISDQEASKILGVAVQTLRNWRATGQGPAYTKISNRLVRYRVDDLHDFMNQHRVSPGNLSR